MALEDKATKYSSKSSFCVEKLYTYTYLINDYKSYLFDMYVIYFIGIAIALSGLSDEKDNLGLLTSYKVVKFFYEWMRYEYSMDKKNCSRSVVAGKQQRFCGGDCRHSRRRRKVGLSGFCDMDARVT